MKRSPTTLPLRHANTSMVTTWIRAETESRRRVCGLYVKRNDFYGPSQLAPDNVRRNTYTCIYRPADAARISAPLPLNHTSQFACAFSIALARASRRASRKREFATGGTTSHSHTQFPSQSAPTGYAMSRHTGANRGRFRAEGSDADCGIRLTAGEPAGSIQRLCR